MQKIVLIGAGSAMFTAGIAGDLIRSGEEWELVLVDIDPDALRVSEGLVNKMRQSSPSPLRVRATLDRREALPGADAVITTIGVGGRRAWEQDVFIARRHGIFMPVGDTAGPCGTARALRMVPAMLAIARDVMELCPQAAFFNYSNPMAVICRALRQEGIPVTGLCIGTLHTSQRLARVLGVPPAEVDFAAAGINHLTWFYRVRARGKDQMPTLAEYARGVTGRADAALRAHRSSGQPMPHNGSPFDSSLEHPFAWQCLLWFGAFPSPEDRHVTEFFPQFFRTGAYYGKTLGVDEFSFEGTIEVGDSTFAAMREEALSAGPLGAMFAESIGGEQEQAVDIIRAMRDNRSLHVFANLPNRGQAPNLPWDAIVEAPALVSAGGVRPVMQPALPAGAAGVLASRMAWVDLCVEAARSQRREALIQALILDGAVSSPDQAAALADDIRAAQLPWNA